MEIEFVKPYLLELYTHGRSQNKKHRFQPNVILKYIQIVDRLRSIGRMEDLYAIKSLNFKKLQGDKAGLWSVRVNHQYRIEIFLTQHINEIQTIIVCSIVDLSNHYT
jgi:toxin HigB-1